MKIFIFTTIGLLLIAGGVIAFFSEGDDYYETSIIVMILIKKQYAVSLKVRVAAVEGNLFQ